MRHWDDATLLATALVAAHLAGATAWGDLGDAVDAPSLIWTTSGDAVWFGQTTNTHDSADAAASGQILDSEISLIETEVTGPGTLAFWWRVESEHDPCDGTGFDFLEFQIDNVSPDPEGLSGITDWQLKSYSIPSGSHTLTWFFQKDGSDFEDYPKGEDRGWLDEVRFFTAPFAPLVGVDPVDQLVLPGDNAAFTISAIGTAPLTYQWRRNGTNLASMGNVSGVSTDTLTLSSVSSNDASSYSVIISNGQGSVTSAVATLILAPALEDAVDSPALAFATGGDVAWFGQFSTSQDGTDAAASGTIGDEEESWLEATVTGPGTLTFWWKVSSEEVFDKLEFLVDQGSVAAIDGEVDWAQVSQPIAEGTHVVRWSYMKDVGCGIGQDRGWIDQVTFIPEGPLPFSLTIDNVSNNQVNLSLAGESNRSYRLLCSSNLLDWIPVQTNSHLSGSVSFVDSFNVDRGQRFYRAETD